MTKNGFSMPAATRRRLLPSVRDRDACAWGVDVGGTTTRVGVVAAGQVLAAATLPTDQGRGPEDLVARIAATAHGLGLSGATAAGVGVPGLLDDDGCLHHARHFPGWDGVPLRALVSTALGVPAVLVNDAEAAALGELHSGHHAGARRLLVLTVGTGLGVSLVHDGTVLGGAGGRMPFAPAEAGRYRLLEDVLSATALLREAALLPRFAGRPPLRCEELTTPDALTDPRVRLVWDAAGEALGWACATVGQLFFADRIVVNGGVSGAGSLLLDPARAFFAAHAALLAQRCEVVVSRLGSDAAVVGAASAALAPAAMDAR
ncbi:MAG: glucokinase [Frankiaceae bacterium]|jgi:glucokinase|nr:glucokinase [Frankiaceae bacterium]